MRILKVPIEKVEPWEKNPRGIKQEDFERLKRQILKLGVYKPLICYQENGKYITLGGNMRIRALRELGVREVEISIVRPKTEAEKIEFSLSDNDRVGYYEEQALAELIYPYLAKLDLNDFKVDVGKPGLDLEDIYDLYGPDLKKADEIPELDDSPAITKPGENYCLGKHRLMCGDSTEKKHVEKLMAEEKADMLFTDPPYRLATKDFGSVLNKRRQYGKMDSSKVFDYGTWLAIAKDIMAANSMLLVWEHKDNLKELWLALEKLFKVNGLIIWYAINRNNYFRHPLTGLFNKFDICLIASQGKKKFSRSSQAPQDLIEETVEREQRSGQSEVFGSKPVEILIPYIQIYTQKNDIVLDLFTGSGSTLIACEKTHRIFYGMEIFPKYCDVIIKRYANYVGISEEKIRKTRQ